MKDKSLLLVYKNTFFSFKCFKAVITFNLFIVLNPCINIKYQ